MCEANVEIMLKNIQKKLSKHGINFTVRKKLAAIYLDLQLGYKIGVGSEFAGKYTLYKNDEEIIHNSNADKIIDKINL